MTINLTAIIKSKEESINEVKNLLLQMVERSRQEEGCLQYDLHQSTTKSNLFVFHEVWKNQETFDLHNNQAYIKRFFELAPNILCEAPEVIFTSKCPVLRV